MINFDEELARFKPSLDIITRIIQLESEGRS